MAKTLDNLERDSPMFAIVCAVILDCPKSDPADPCRIPLTFQSLLGMCERAQAPPMGSWPAIFLCMKHAHVCVRSPRNVQIEHEIRVPDEPVPSLWRIECECAHENCGKQQAIYTSRAPDWETIERVILLRKPVLSCNGHPFVWRSDLMRGIEIPHVSLLR